MRDVGLSGVYFVDSDIIYYVGDRLVWRAPDGANACVSVRVLIAFSVSFFLVGLSIPVSNCVYCHTCSFVFIVYIYPYKIAAR